MGKKNKKKKQEFVDPYTLAYMKSQGDIESVSCDVSDNVEIDDDGTPFVVDDRDDYIYEDAPQAQSVVTPSYMDFLMQGAKNGKKKSKKEKRQEDYEDRDLSEERPKERSVEEIMNERSVEVSKVDIPADLEELFPGAFDTAGEEAQVDIDRDENDGWFGPAEAYEDVDPEEEAEEAAEEEPDYQVSHIEHAYPIPEEPVIEPSPVESPKIEKPSWVELSRFCAMHFEPIEKLGRLIIDDRIAPTCVIDSVINMKYFDIDLDAVREMLYSTDTEGNVTLDLTYLQKVQDAVWMYILSSKHPAAIFTLKNFMEAFENIDHIDNKNFKFVYDSRNRESIGDMIYAYHIPAAEQRHFDNYVKAVSKGFLDDDEFFPDRVMAERKAIAKFLVIVWIAEHLQEQREVFPSHDADYVTTFRTAGINPDDDMSFPTFNKLIDFVTLIHDHRATEYGTPKTYKDLDNIFGIYDFDMLRDVCFDVFDKLIPDEDDDDDEDIDESELEDDTEEPVQPFFPDFSKVAPTTELKPEEMVGTHPEPSQVETPEIVDVDDDVDIDFDPMELTSQIDQYTEDETDYSSLIDPNAKEDTATSLADALYQDYKSEVVKNGGKILTKEELADQVRGGIVGEMHVPSSVAKAEPTPKEEPKNDIGSSTMMEALAKAGCKTTKQEKSPVTSLGSVPVFRK
jgi:hypothetical protein|nr:MAG TPA: hypothetical protein [Caudoviricetes sp.]